jgi:hypothetical protein
LRFQALGDGGGDPTEDMSKTESEFTRYSSQSYLKYRTGEWKEQVIMKK